MPRAQLPGPVLSESQQQIFDAIVGTVGKVILLVGGPGTGKTAVVLSLSLHFGSAGYAVRYLAPLRQITNKFEHLAGAGISYTTQRYNCNNQPTHAVQSARRGAHIYKRGRLGTVLFVDETFATSWADIRDIEITAVAIYGTDVRFVFVGDPYQLRNPEGGPAANARLLSPPNIQIFKMADHSHRSTHPWLTTVVKSLRGTAPPVVADRMLTESNYWKKRRFDLVDMWLVATHAEVETRNQRWQASFPDAASFVGTSVNGTTAPHKFPARLVAGQRAMLTEAVATKRDDGTKVEWSNRTQVIVKTWGRELASEDTPPEAFQCSAGDLEVKILVEPLLPDGQPSGKTLWVAGCQAAENKMCRWFPLQGLGAIVCNCAQGMTFAEGLRVGIDGTEARDPRAWWTVALTRSVVPHDADLRDYYPVINYPPGAAHQEGERTKAEINLRKLCT